MVLALGAAAAMTAPTARVNNFWFIYMCYKGIAGVASVAVLHTGGAGALSGLVLGLRGLLGA